MGNKSLKKSKEDVVYPTNQENSSYESETVISLEHSKSIMKLFSLKVDQLFTENSYLNSNGYLLKQSFDITNIAINILMYSVPIKERKFMYLKIFEIISEIYVDADKNKLFPNQFFLK